MRNKGIVGYVVSGPSGHYDYETETLREAYDLLAAEGDEGWAVGVRFADGSVSFESVRRGA